MAIPTLVSYYTSPQLPHAGLLHTSKGDYSPSVPWGFRKLLNYIHKRYLANTSLTIYITENGFPVENEGDLPLEQALKDTHRQEYYASYIKEMALAHKEDGVRMGGYMAWSLLE